MGDYANAADYYRTVTEIDPSNKVAYLELGNAYYCTREYEKAIEPLQKAC